MKAREARGMVRRARCELFVVVGLDSTRTMLVQVSKRQLLRSLGRASGKTVQVEELWGALVIGA